MLITCLIAGLVAGLCGVTWNQLSVKWKVDDYFNTHPVYSKYYPFTAGNYCHLCRMFWAAQTVYSLLLLFPLLHFVFVPFALIPLQRILSEWKQ